MNSSLKLFPSAIIDYNFCDKPLACCWSHLNIFLHKIANMGISSLVESKSGSIE